MSRNASDVLHSPLDTDAALRELRDCLLVMDDQSFEDLIRSESLESIEMVVEITKIIMGHHVLDVAFAMLPLLVGGTKDLPGYQRAALGEVLSRTGEMLKNSFPLGKDSSFS